MRLTLRCLLGNLFLASLVVSCGAEPVKHSLSEATQTDPRFDSRYLMTAGQNSMTLFFKQIEERNKILEKNNSPFKLMVVDARDPRLYNGGFPIQPPTPATRAVVRVAANGSGAWVLSAWLLEAGPQSLEVKAPNGGFVFGVIYGVDRIQFSTATGGVVGSVTRNTSGYGWNYVYYLRGLGNAVTPAMFDQAVFGLITDVVLAL